MKKVYILIMFSLFIVASNVAAADLNGRWEGYMYCSNDPAGDPGEHFIVEITQNGEFFTSENIEPTPGEICGGVLDGNKIYMTCPSTTGCPTGTFAYGEIKGNTIYVINHVPCDGKTCTGTADRIK